MNFTKTVRNTSIIFSLLIIGLTPAFASITHEVNIPPLANVKVATEPYDNDSVLVHVRFNDYNGQPLNHVNYDIAVWYKSNLLLDDTGVHMHGGVGGHITAPINYEYSFDDTVDVIIVFQGIGLSPPYEGPIGEVFRSSEWLEPPSPTLPINLDNTPPLIIGSKDIVIGASGSSGTVVEYSIKAIDDIDGVISPQCNPMSGSKFPVGITTVKCFVNDNAGNYVGVEFNITVEGSTVSIPLWVREVAGFWCNDEIDDSGFVDGIQYLINKNVIVIPSSDHKPGSSLQHIPAWIKNNACWWSNGNIEDNDFTRGIQYLVRTGIIQV